MIIGVPAEVKEDEYRVAMLPVGVEELTARGHKVIFQAGAGLGSGLADHAYLEAGAKLVASIEDVYKVADMIVKVKEPQANEFSLIRSGQTLFTYFHFAASRQLTDAMIACGANCLAYETLEDERGRLSLLTPMSEVAGRMSIQEGAKFLERPQQGRGILLGGVPGVPPANILILGGGIVGSNAAKIAAGFRADVNILDVNMDRLRYLDDVMPPNVNALYSDRHTIRDQLKLADLVIGAVLIPGAKAPHLVTKEMLKDIAVLTGGRVISEEVCLKLENTKLEDLGKAGKVVVTKDNTLIVDGAGDKKEIAARIEEIKGAIEQSKSDFDKEKLQERMAKLSGGVAILYIGAAT